jgi:putative flippase GtrA
MLFDWITRELIAKFLKFCVVGVIGTAVDFGTTALCKEVLKIQKYISNAIGFTLAATGNYLLNRNWTFVDSKSPDRIAAEYLTFMVVSVIGLGINTLTLYLVSKKLKKGFYFSKIGATGITMLWNFFANLLITFAR